MTCYGASLLVNQKAKSMILIRLPYVWVILLSFVSAIGSLALSTALGYVFYFENIVSTNCRPNLIPSISAVTGQYTPGRYVWRVGVAFMSTPRLLDSYLSYKYFGATTPARESWLYSILNKINWFCFVAEYLSLFTLSYVTMHENYSVHRKGFIFFVTFSSLHMLLTCYLFKTGRPLPWSYNEKASWKLRLWTMTSFVLMLLGGTYFYIRKHLYCEPYMHSYSAICEYLLVLSNILFHTSLCYDLRECYLTIAFPILSTLATEAVQA